MSFNDHPTAAIVDMIGQQEKAHVAIGVSSNPELLVAAVALLAELFGRVTNEESNWSHLSAPSAAPAGVFWFKRLTAALGLESAASYRSWLSNLCPDLLQGRMNHEARSEVGLQRSW